MRRLLLIALVLILLLPSSGATTPVRLATRIVFSGIAAVDRTQQIYSVEPSGRGLAQLTFGPDSAWGAVPSPDGRHIAFLRSNSIWVMRPDGTGQRRVVADGRELAWTPDSRRIAYVAFDRLGNPVAIHAVGLDSSGDHVLVHAPARVPQWSPDGRSLAFVWQDSLFVLRERPERTQSQIVVGRVDPYYRLAWSPDGRWIAFEREENEGYLHLAVEVVQPDGSHRRIIGAGGGPTWSPDGRRLAFVGNELVVVDVRSGGGVGRGLHNAREVAWAPDGSRLAYTDPLAHQDFGGDVGTITLSRKGQTLASPYRSLEGLSWMTPPSGLRYTAPPPLAQAVGTELRLRVPIDDLAADGGRAAYRICGTIGVWQPGAASVVAVRTQSPLCGNDDTRTFYGLALAADRVAWGAVQGGNSKSGWLTVAPVAASGQETVVSAPRGRTSGDPRGDTRSGDLLGAGVLLVFSEWAFCDDLGQPCVGIGVTDRRILAQSVVRVRDPSWPETCSLGVPRSPYGLPVGRCQNLRIERGPLRPLDVDDGRIVASGDNATVVLDEEGRQLLSVPVKASSGALAGPDLLLIMNGEMHRYDAATGMLRGTWPIPAIEDAARGRVAYVRNGQVHVLVLSNGLDTVVHDGTAARFGDTGLYYTFRGSAPWPGRIGFLRFDRLPLR